ncbi:hypothetical protein NP493_2272g00001 [Ridgeia piscesae]|uniref:Uncharacterized protein n=1 Tax=Ridgeia piscesae TaxID=27915 RepID=A0AAD9JIN7_RIDPI|nr:hypothetical protein NP493_2272g00001 [Ridgeia piscesae]
MRATIVLLFAFLALAFVAAYAADEEEEDESRVAVGDDSEDVSVDGVRVERAAHKRLGKPPKPKHRRAKGGGKRQGYRGGGQWQSCACYYWSGGNINWFNWGCKVYGNIGTEGWVWRNPSWRWAGAEGIQGAYCECHFWQYIKCWTRS